MEKLDPIIAKKAMVLTNTIKQIESNGNYNALSQEAKKTGDIGKGYGAFQYDAPTWKTRAKTYLGDENADIRNPRNQDRVQFMHVYTRLKNKTGVEDIFAEHNGGAGAMGGKWKTRVGVNDSGVAYSIPQYMEKAKKELVRQMQMTQQITPNLPQKKETPIEQEQTTETPEKKQSFLSKAGYAIAQPFVKLGLTASEKLFPNRELSESGQILKNQFESKGMDVTANTAREAIGAAGEGLLTTFSGGIAKPVGTIAKGAINVAKNPIKTGILKVAGQAAKEGAIMGGLTGAAQSLQGDGGIKDFAKQTAAGTALGGVIGGAGSAVIGGATKAIGKAGILTGAKTVTKEVADSMKEKVATDLKKFVSDKKSLTNRYSKILLGKDVDVIDHMISRGVVPELGESGNLYDTTKAYTTLSNKYKIKNQVLERYVQKLDNVKPLPKEKTTTDSVKKITNIYNQTKTDLSATQRKRVASIIRAELRDIPTTRQGLQNAKKKYYKLSTSYSNTDPAVIAGDADAYAIIARAYKEMLEDALPNGQIKNINRELTKDIVTLDFLNPTKAGRIHGSAVNVGRLGRYIAGAVGASIGSQSKLPVIGAILGPIIGDRLVTVLNKLSVASPIERKIIMQNADNPALLRTLENRIKKLNELGKEKLAKAKQQEIKKFLLKGKGVLALPSPSGKPLSTTINLPENSRTLSVEPKAKNNLFKKEVNSAMQDSIKKAKEKGISFDEWVEGKQQVFHGTKSDIGIAQISSQSNSRGQYLGNGIYFTKYKEGADLYGGKTLEAIVDNSDFLDISKLKGIERTKEIGSLGTYKQYLKNNNLTDTTKNFDIWSKNQKSVADKVLQMGYKGITDGQQHVIFDKSALKTRSQLKAEWDKIK